MTIDLTTAWDTEGAIRQLLERPRTRRWLLELTAHGEDGRPDPFRAEALRRLAARLAGESPETAAAAERR
jgi:hypothetical protein